MKLGKRLTLAETRIWCSVCGGDKRHLCQRCREKVGIRHI
jgi:hypothetical protein